MGATTVGESGFTDNQEQHIMRFIERHGFGRRAEDGHCNAHIHNTATLDAIVVEQARQAGAIDIIKWAVPIIGGLLGFLLIIVGWFINRTMNSIDDRLNNVVVAVTQHNTDNSNAKLQIGNILEDVKKLQDEMNSTFRNGKGR